MNSLLCFALRGNEELAKQLSAAIGAETGPLKVRHFPDGETYLRYGAPVRGRAVVLCCSLDRPDEKFLPLIFAAATARDLGADVVGLVCPYLAYLRQDRRFHDGEARTSAVFAEMLSRHIDWLVTVDPHLHRYKSLDQIYGVPSAVAHAAALLSRWIAAEVEHPLLIGPDSESAQWVESVARDARAPFEVLTKRRRGDRDVEVSLPHVERWREYTPVLVDDIVSTARTMIETVTHLRDLGTKPPVCVAVHGIFAGNALQALKDAGAARIVTTNTVPNETSAIDVTSLLAEGVRGTLLEG